LLVLGELLGISVEPVGVAVQASRVVTQARQQRVLLPSLRLPRVGLASWRRCLCGWCRVGA